jgi:beta-mannosidase
MPTRSLAPAVWQLARLSSAGSVVESADWIPATVPGAVQLDWARARDLPDLNFGQNVRAYEGLEDFFWLYRTTVPAASLQADERLMLAGGGLDYHAELRVAGRTVLVHTGLCTPFELDLTDAAPGSPLEILIHPAPKRQSSPADRSQAAHVTKPAVSYGWDWHPRLITLGLCEEVRFEVRPAVHLRHVDFAYTLTDDFSEAHITVSIETSAPAAFRWTLRDPEGRVVLDADGPTATLASPRLWWTHDHGEPALYSVEVTLAAPGADTVVRRVGFRRVRLVMQAGAWDHPSGFPKSRSHPPTTVELNGRRLFARGSNWVNPEIFPGRINADTYRSLLALARDAHFNLLRCWGGAPVAKDSFFEQCDALGLLVWQEFPLACNCYPDTSAYLADLDRESRAIIRRVRQHPSLALWCGGNELFNAWSGMDDQSLALRLLNRNCFDLDPTTPFIATAPLDGMGHGDYRFRDETGRDIFQIFQSGENTAYSEFGCPGPSSVDYLKTFIPAGELWPPRPGTSWETHHAFGAWDMEPTSWLCTATIQHYFGESTSLEQLVARGEWLQCEGYKSVFEEARRQAPRCAMALNWCYNEPWPTAANNSIISYPALPKPAFYAVQAACRPVLASARIPKFQWKAGEAFTAELWLLNDHPAAHAGGELVATLECDGRSTELLRWGFSGLAPQQSLAGPSVRAVLPETDGGEFTLLLSEAGHPEWDSRYRLSIRPSRRPAVAATRAMNT